jgi:uncharacterized membrane protein
MRFVYRIFIKGLLTLLPITITLYLLVWFTTRAEDAFGGPLRALVPFYFPGAGVVVVLFLIFLTGLLVNYYVTQRFFAWLEKSLEKAPVIKTIYGPIRDLTKLFAAKDDASVQKVVMVHLPGLGVEVMGLVTRDQFKDLPQEAVHDGSLAVFIPFSYGVGGFTVIVPRASVRETSLPAEKALQLAITGWVKSSK